MSERTQLDIMRRAVREEERNPLHPSFGPDTQAAITDYLNSGGEDGDVGDLEQLCREAMEAEGLDY